MLLYTITLFAVPAKRELVTVEQRDGSTIEISRFGDEFFHYTTTSDGYLISQSDGLYYYSDVSSDGEFTRSTQRASDPSFREVDEMQFVASRLKGSASPELKSALAKSQQRRASVNASRLSSVGSVTRSGSSVRGIVILVEFPDEEFTFANDDFHSMLNDENYSTNSGTGSARDFFVDNSMGQFQPSFDVVGPYTLSQTMAYYGGNDSSGLDQRPRDMVTEACELADEAGLDFSQYDSDSDGYVDMVFVFYAGYNEAEGASEDTIWPHMWSLSSSQTYDGKRVFIYACTSELKGSGTTVTNGRQPVEAEAVMASIGTFTHEYGHTLGLADSYDTTGDEDGTSMGLHSFDIMSYGNYNNNGATPPHYCAYQRYELGWIEPQQISAVDNYTMEDISTNSAYIVPTDVDDEYFLLEYRNTTERGLRMWDGYIGYSYDVTQFYCDLDGLFITHIDRSTNVVGNTTAAQMWLDNMPNGDFSHECARVVYSDASVTTVDTSSSSEYTKSLKSMVFPGSTNNDTFTPTSSPAAVSWSGAALPIELSNIRTLDGTLYFTNGTPTETDDDTVDTTIYGEGYPFISVEVGEWSDSYSTLRLSLKNLTDYDDIEWTIDGLLVSSSVLHIVEKSGSFCIKCRVTTGDDELRITKFLEL